jgi:WhiB family redox-sensing transcriptional regulator
MKSPVNSEGRWTEGAGADGHDTHLPCTREPDLFFAEDQVLLESAKALCGRCLARRACLSGALARREPVGVWGGQMFDHGQVIGQMRRPGRPSKRPPERPAASAPPALTGDADMVS